MSPQDELRNVEISIEIKNDVSGSDPRAKENVVVSSERDTSHDYEVVLELIGFGKCQWIVLFISGLLLMMVINETMGMSIITITSQCDFQTNSMEKAIMSAASFIGILASSYFWGYFSDTKGRRWVLIYSTFIGNFISFASMFLPNYWTFVSSRFLVGIFIAGASSTTYAYLGEFFVPRHRPVVINYASMFVGIGMAYVPAVAWMVLSMNWSFEIFETFAFRPWRLVILFNLLPGFLAALILLKLPESPKILIARNKTEEAYQAANWICLRNTGQPLTERKIFKLKTESKPLEENIFTTSKSGCYALKKMWQETQPLFQAPHAVNFLISCCIMCGFFLISSGMGLWFPEIQNRVGASSGNDTQLSVCKIIDAFIDANQVDEADVVCDDTVTTKSLIDSITYGLSYIVGYLVLGAIINPLGRKTVIVGSLVLSGVFGMSLYWILNPIAVVVCFCLFLLLPGLCISVLSGALVDLVPTQLRGKAVCICLMLGRSGSVIGSNIIGILLDSYCIVTFGVFSGVAFVCAFLTLFLPI